MGLRWNGRPFRSHGPSASIQPQRRSSMRASTTAPAWRSVCPRPRRTSPSPSGDSASGAFRPTISCGFGSLPQEVLAEARAALLGRRNILVSGGTGSGKTTLLNALVELLPADDRIVSIEDTLELRIDRKNCVRFEARGIDGESVTIRDLVKHALRHRPDHIVVGEVRGGEAADLLQALNTGHGGSLTTIHANNAESALSRLATCAMQGETDLPWEVTCRGVVDGISMVIHMTRREGRRYVEEALHVGDYDAAKRRWHYRPVTFADPQLKLAEVR